MKFTDLRLAEPIVRAVAAEGYETPTPIQAKAIPEALSGNDVLGCAQTGTGKTGAFALPILHMLAANPGPTAPGQPRALILCPTRELASQIHESFRVYGRGLKLHSTAVFGGVGKGNQIRNLRRGVDILVATPGRLFDLMSDGFIDLSRVETLVLDEADQMLDMGFIHDIRKVVQMIPESRQTLFFSATMPKEIRRLADAILRDPVFVEAAPVATTADSIEQSVFFVTKKNKPELLSRLLSSEYMGRTLVFSRTKHGADKLVKGLRKTGVRADAIHGNKSQNARTRALDAFKAGRTHVLVATDIASRGIDVDAVTHVINYDIPNVPESYVHRIGRTARAGASGIAVSFCDYDEVSDLRMIERLIKQRLNVVENHAELLFQAPDPGQRTGGQGQSRGGGHSSGKSNSGPPRRRRGAPRATPARRTSAPVARRPAGAPPSEPDRHAFPRTAPARGIAPKPTTERSVVPPHDRVFARLDRAAVSAVPFVTASPVRTPTLPRGTRPRRRVTSRATRCSCSKFKNTPRPS